MSKIFPVLKDTHRQKSISDGGENVDFELGNDSSSCNKKTDLSTNTTSGY